MIQPSVLQKLRTIVGSSNFFDSPEDRISYSYDGTPLISQLPVAILRPDSVVQVAAILRTANEEQFAIVPRGSGSGLSGGAVPSQGSIVLLMNHWNRILEIDEQNLTAWVEPGVITGTFQSTVEAKGFLYPPDPGSASISSLGGNVAENSGGLRGLKYGVTKNYVMGLEVVLPTGEVMHFGGKSVKDVAGYNLKDLLVGSEGTLGVFTKILLRLIPKPEVTRTMLVSYETLTKAAETVSGIVAAKITPAALEFLDQTTIRCVEAYAHLGLSTSVGGMLLIELDGHRLAVEDESQRVQEICRRGGGINIAVASTTAEAAKLRTARKAAFSSLARVKPTTILEDATVPRSELAPMLEAITSIASKHNLIFGNFGHAGDGNLHPTCLTDERDADEIRRAESAFEEIFGAAVNMGGTITGEHGVGLSKKKFFEKHADPAALHVMRSLKTVLDPQNVLNPGKVFSLKPRCEGPMPASRAQVQKFLDLGAFT